MSTVRAQSLPAFKLPVTVEEYLTEEENSDVQHEFLNGLMRAMASPSPRHMELVGNFREFIGPALRRRGCRSFIEKMKVHVRVATGSFFYYPDIVVACGQTAVTDNYLEDATLIVEVLSDSTAHTDRAEKFFMYQQLPGFAEYVLVDQHETHIMVLRKSAGWKPELFENMDQSFRLETLDCSLRVADIYTT